MKLHEACKRFFIDYDFVPGLTTGSFRKSFRTKKQAQDFVNSLPPCDRATLHVRCTIHYEFLEEDKIK